MINILEFNSNFCIMFNLKIISNVEIVLLTSLEDMGNSRDKLLESLAGKNYLIICNN